MSATRRRDLAFWAAIVVAAVVFLPPAVAPASALATGVLTPQVQLWFGALAKLAALLVAATFAVRSRAGFGEDNPARGAWTLLATGLVLYAVGQVVLVVYQLVLAIEAPYPSLADAFFLCAMVLLVVAFGRFVGAYERAGFPLDRRRDVVATGAVGAVAFAALCGALLRPVLGGAGFGLKEMLDLAYPLLDLLLFVPALILLRVSWRLRGGRVWRIWLALVAGALLLAAGDILFAYFTVVDSAVLSPLVDLAFLAAYLCLARGTSYQHELLHA